MKKYIYPLTLCLGFSLFSCSSDSSMFPEYDDTDVNDIKHTCKVEMNIIKTGYDDDLDTRSAEGWENGDVVYLILETTSGQSYGDAVYNDGSWQLTYFGSLISGESTNCMAVYIDNPGSEMGSVIMLNPGSAIYEDSNGQYIYEDGVLSVTANLSPKTGRIRFEGTDGQAFNLYGITTYTAFDTSTGNFTWNSDVIASQVSENYTDYIYGFFTDLEEPRVNVIYAESAFTRQFPTSIFKAGESGYVTLPTASSHSGWRNNAIFNINGVDLTMIPVEFEEGNFLLAETETTEELYYAVMGTGDSTLLPKSGFYSSDWKTFCTTLYKNYRLDFRFPTWDEWVFAYKGGNKSQGFTYSGSDNIYDVAWFSGNSDGKKHPVKQLLPNELGFYDMAGNVAEFTTYNSSDAYGGYYSASANYCTPTLGSWVTTSTYSGFRLCLSL